MIQFTTVVSLAEILIYLACIVLYGISDDSFLAVSEGNPIVAFCEKDPYKMRYQEELWRFLTPVFVHKNLVHIVANLTFQVVLGSFLENSIGLRKFVILYFSTG